MLFSRNSKGFDPNTFLGQKITILNDWQQKLAVKTVKFKNFSGHNFFVMDGFNFSYFLSLLDA